MLGGIKPIELCKPILKSLDILEALGYIHSNVIVYTGAAALLTDEYKQQKQFKGNLKRMLIENC